MRLRSATRARHPGSSRASASIASTKVGSILRWRFSISKATNPGASFRGRLSIGAPRTGKDHPRHTRHSLIARAYIFRPPAQDRHDTCTPHPPQRIPNLAPDVPQRWGTRANSPTTASSREVVHHAQRRVIAETLIVGSRSPHLDAARPLGKTRSHVLIVDAPPRIVIKGLTAP